MSDERPELTLPAVTLVVPLSESPFGVAAIWKTPVGAPELRTIRLM
jgi:hypothetical protein